MTSPSVRMSTLRMVAQGYVVFVAGILVVAGEAAAQPLVTFEWVPASTSVSPGTTSLQVDLIARQQGGANAAAVTVGFFLTGAVTGVGLAAYGPDVSVADSFFGTFGSNLVLISVAGSPGTFGVDADFTVATLNLAIHTPLGPTGSAGLVDLTSIAGPPVLEIDGVTPIPSNLGQPFVLTVVPPAVPVSGPMVSAALMLVLGSLGFWTSRRARVQRGFIGPALRRL
jgi:hypothetical protein